MTTGFPTRKLRETELEMHAVMGRYRLTQLLF